MDSQQTPIHKQTQSTQEIVPKVQPLPEKPVKQTPKQEEQLTCRTEKIYADFKEIFSKDWRPRLDKNGRTRLAFTDNISCSPKNLDPSSTNQPFHLICVKGLDNLPLPDHNVSVSTEEQEALNETLFNLLKTSYVKLLKKAIEARFQILQLTLLKAPFPQINKQAADTLSQTALLQAIREVTCECRSL